MTKTKCQREFEDLFTKEKGWDLEVYDYLDGLPDQPRYSDDSTYKTWIGFKEGYKAALASQRKKVKHEVK